MRRFQSANNLYNPGQMMYAGFESVTVEKRQTAFYAVNMVPLILVDGQGQEAPQSSQYYVNNNNNCYGCQQPLSSHYQDGDGNKLCAACMDQKYSKQCDRCNKPILQYTVVQKAVQTSHGQRTFHEACMTCVNCNKSLLQGYYKLNRRSYNLCCAACYDLITANSCYRCNRKICGVSKGEKELAIPSSSGGTNFCHDYCFNCDDCKSFLGNGYHRLNGNIFCEQCISHHKPPNFGGQFDANNRNNKTNRPFIGRPPLLQANDESQSHSNPQTPRNRNSSSSNVRPFGKSLNSTDLNNSGCPPVKPIVLVQNWLNSLDNNLSNHYNNNPRGPVSLPYPPQLVVPKYSNPAPKEPPPPSYSESSDQLNIQPYQFKRANSANVIANSSDSSHVQSFGSAQNLQYRPPIPRPFSGKTSTANPPINLPSGDQNNESPISRRDSSGGGRHDPKNVDKKHMDAVMAEIINPDDLDTCLDDVVGLDEAKSVLNEAVILPTLRPDLFTGPRIAHKGVLLFGPPGNGKTFLAKAIAKEAKTTFFNVSAGSITSMWCGESEQKVRALFIAARKMQPSMIFLDECDSLLAKRKNHDNEFYRRTKTEFLVQCEGLCTSNKERILLMAATNRPWDLDEAFLSRVPRRIYVPLPCEKARLAVFKHWRDRHSAHVALSDNDMASLARGTQGYSARDITNLLKDASMGPIRELSAEQQRHVPEVRNITANDVRKSLKKVKPTAAIEPGLLEKYEEWSMQNGSG